MLTEISIRKWVHRGMMMYATDGLDHDDPDHPYNQALAQGVKPENYGLKHSLALMFEGKTREDLIHEILTLRKELEGYIRHGF